MTRKQALCSVVRIFNVPIDKTNLTQISRLEGSRSIIKHRYYLFCGLISGEGNTIRQAFDDLCRRLR